MLLIQALPLIALVALLATGRVGPVWSCAVAFVLALPAAWLKLGDAAAVGGFIGQSLAEGIWLALIPVGIITGGLVFHAAVQHRAGARVAHAQGDPADEVFTAAFMLGPFTEAVTGFGVGIVFVMGALRVLGLKGAPAVAIALLSQTIIPWGGLGPGTAIGAALAGMDPQLLATRSALLLAPSWMLLLPLFWWWAGLAGLQISCGARLAQACWVLLMAALLIVAHRFLPWQLCGMLACGLVLSVRLLMANPPRSGADVGRMLTASAPYLLLASLLLASQAWHGAPAFRPYPGLPGLPLNHAMVALWLAALIMLAVTRRGPGFAWTALQRGKRPAVALISFVLLARVLGNAGIPVALAAALVSEFGSAAPYASPLLAVISGFFAGTNVGANSAMMPLQAALGVSAGLGATVLPGVQNGTLALILSPQLTAVGGGLIGGGVTPSQIWRIMWPVALIAWVVGTASIAIG